MLLFLWPLPAVSPLPPKERGRLYFMAHSCGVQQVSGLDLVAVAIPWNSLCKGNLQMAGFKPPKSCPLIASGRTTEALRMSGVLSDAGHKQLNDRDGQKGNTFSWLV